MSEEDIRQLSEAFSKSQDSIESDLTFFGNKYTIMQVITLLCYIRNAINNNQKATIEVQVGNNVSDREFEFLVNNQKADNMNVKKKLEIN